MKFKYILILVLFPFLLNAQGGFIVESGAKVVVKDSPHIIINDGKFKNDGDFTPGSSTVHITGNTDVVNSTIGGMTVTSFNNLNINKTSNDSRLDFDIKVNGDINMNGGLLILNYSDIQLGGVIKGETETNRITGVEGGAIIKSLELDTPTGVNPGNLGVEITSPIDLGMTTIRRSHVQMENGGNLSIQRRYDISPENEIGLDATVRFHYFDAELSVLVEDDLEMWQYDGSDWISFGSGNSNIIDNWVEASGLTFFHTLTLAEDMAQPLPIESVSYTHLTLPTKRIV